MSLSLHSLCSYYLDCLSKEIKEGHWRYASNTAGNLDYGQLFYLPHYGGEDIYKSIDSVNTINKVITDEKRFVLQLGYPINIRQPIGKGFLIIEPLLLFQFDTQSFRTGGTPKLLDEAPVFNFEAIKNLSGLLDTELLNEVIALSEELSLNEPFSLEDDFDIILSQLQQIRPHWNWKENITPNDLTKELLNIENQTGIYNAAALFSTETSKFTKGLETELNELKKLSPEKFSDNAFYSWITGKFPNAPVMNKFFNLKKGQNLIQPFPLNEEQKNAVEHALDSPLTVIKGPPGTGKSQVVSSIIINAIYQGQTVLFTSKNNKAVNVVFERVEGLSSSPAMLRLGSGDKLRAKLNNTLSNILAATVTENDRKDFKYFEDLHQKHIRQQSRIEFEQGQLVNCVNRLSRIEISIKPFRELIGEELLLEIKNWPLSRFQEIENLINRFQIALNKADGDKQGLIVQLFWFVLERPRFKALTSIYNLLKIFFPALGTETPTKPLKSDTLPLYYDLNKKLKIHLKYAKDVQEYFRILSQIKNHKSLFQLSKESQQLESDLTENSNDLWNSWLKLLPERIDDCRDDLSNYLALINLIAGANAQGVKPPHHIWGQFYALQEKVTYILSCWSVTSLSAKGRVPFKSGFFDLVIIDEASQCDIASALPLLYRAKRAVIIGDNKQLTHITAINGIQDLQLRQKYNLGNQFKWSYSAHSLFELSLGLSSTKDVIMLNEHHRSHSDIIGFSNKNFYNNELRVATKYSNLKPIPNEPTVRWADVIGKVIRPDNGGSLNQIEAQEVYREVKRIISNGYRGTIGVVTPFKAQKNRINDLIWNDNNLLGHLAAHNFLCDTVHKFQGDERDIIIFSPVISHGVKGGSLNYLKNTGNLFNVAITRARATLIVVGDKSYCRSSSISYMEKFVEHVASLESKPINTIAINKYGSKYPKLSSTVMVSQWEKKLYEGLYRHGIKTVPQFQVDQYKLDLALFINGKKLNIEVDGEKYHRNWDGDLVKRDQIRNKRLIEQGWDVMRFWVYQVRDDFNGCILKVQEWIEFNNSEVKENHLDVIKEQF